MNLSTIFWVCSSVCSLLITLKISLSCSLFSLSIASCFSRAYCILSLRVSGLTYGLCIVIWTVSLVECATLVTGCGIKTGSPCEMIDSAMMLESPQKADDWREFSCAVINASKVSVSVWDARANGDWYTFICRFYCVKSVALSWYEGWNWYSGIGTFATRLHLGSRGACTCVTVTWRVVSSNLGPFYWCIWEETPWDGSMNLVTYFGLRSPGFSFPN